MKTLTLTVGLWFGALGLGVAWAQGHGGAPRPPTSGAGWVEATTAGAPAGQFWVKMYFRAATSGPPADKIRTRLTQGAGTTIAGPHDLPPTATRDSFALVRPAAGGSSSGNACLESMRGTLSSGPTCGAYSYTEPLGAPLPPVVDSVKTDTLIVAFGMLPRSAFEGTMRGGDIRYFCVIHKMQSGQAGYRGPRSALCDAQALSVGPALTAAGQAAVDRHCTTLSGSWVTPAPGGVAVTAVQQFPCSGQASIAAATVGGMTKWQPHGPLPPVGGPCDSFGDFWSKWECWGKDVAKAHGGKESRVAL